MARRLSRPIPSPGCLVSNGKGGRSVSSAADPRAARRTRFRRHLFLGLRALVRAVRHDPRAPTRTRTDPLLPRVDSSTPRPSPTPTSASTSFALLNSPRSQRAVLLARSFASGATTTRNMLATCESSDWSSLRGSGERADPTPPSQVVEPSRVRGVLVHRHGWDCVQWQHPVGNEHGRGTRFGHLVRRPPLAHSLGAR